MSDSTLGLKGNLTARKVKNPKASKVFSFSIPGLGRFGYTKDSGEAGFFSTQMYRTRLASRLFSPQGDLLSVADYGAGLVTNVGVLALAYDGTALKFAKAKESFGLLPSLKYHAWGGKNTAATTKDIKLTELKAPNATEATEGANTLTTSGEGKPKLVSKAKIKAESTFEVVEWGIHNQKVLSSTTGTPLTASTATTAKVTATPLTASSEEARGEVGKILVATETSEIWGLITSNTTSEVTVPAWYKQSTGAAETPKSTSPYTLKPVMFDHRVISPISVESGNEIEFIWELEFPSGG